MALGELLLTLHVDLCKACGLIGGRLLDEKNQVWCTDPNCTRLYDYDQSRTRRPYLCLTACYCCGGSLWRPDREVQAIYAAGQQNGQSRAKEAYYFFNQPQVFTIGPAKSGKLEFWEEIEEEGPSHVHADRPTPFRFVDEIELDKDIFLTWDIARPIYETAGGSPQEAPTQILYCTNVSDMRNLSGLVCPDRKSVV